MPQRVELPFWRIAGASGGNCIVVDRVGSHFFGAMGKQAAWPIWTLLVHLPILAHLRLVSDWIQSSVLLSPLVFALLSL